MIERMLKRKCGSIFGKVETRLLTDGAATQILGGLTWLRKQVTQGDVAIVFFSGHGLQDDVGCLFLLPSDVDTTDLLATAVSEDQLKKALAGMPGRAIVMLDACHAGALPVVTTGRDRRPGPRPRDRRLRRDRDGQLDGPRVITGEQCRRSGLLHAGLVEGLSGKADLNKDGVVYLNELDAYLTDRVKELSKVSNIQ